MKKLIILLFFQCTSAVDAQTDLNHMTSEMWVEDLNYLDNKIQKEFNSFIPNIKMDFSEKVDALRLKIPELKNYEAVAELMRLLSTLQDGHTEVNVGHKSIGFHRIPLNLYFFENELYIIDAHDNYKDLVGNKITHIGNFTTEQAFEILKENMSRDNAMEYLHAGPGYFLLTELMAFLGISKSPLSCPLTIASAEGMVQELFFDGITYAEYYQGTWVSLFDRDSIAIPLYLQQFGENYWYEHLEDENTMYFHFRRVNNQKGKPSIAKFTKTLFKLIDEKRPDRLIIDFRDNSGGNYNLSKPLVNAIQTRPWLNQKGKVWAISGRKTFSASSVACIFLKQETNAILIGEPGRTHPNQADNNEYLRLPNSNILVEYTTKIKKHWPELNDLDQIPVDIAIAPSFEKYQNGIDPVLEYIFQQ